MYLTGLSMGGMGTWSIADGASRTGGRRSSPICGRGDTEDGREDQGHALLVLPRRRRHRGQGRRQSRDMIEAIKKAGGKPKYTEYPGVGHNSWDKAYGTDELYKWLLKQSEEVSRTS